MKACRSSTLTALKMGSQGEASHELAPQLRSRSQIRLSQITERVRKGILGKGIGNNLGFGSHMVSAGTTQL